MRTPKAGETWVTKDDDSSFEIIPSPQYIVSISTKHDIVTTSHSPTLMAFGHYDHWSIDKFIQLMKPLGDV